MTARERNPAKPRVKGVYPKRKTLADGCEVTYWYHRKTGARLPDDPWSDEFRDRVAELDRKKPLLPKAAPTAPEADAATRPSASPTAQADHLANVVPPSAAIRNPAPGIPEKCFKALMARFLISPAFLDLEPGTRDEYARHMRYVEPAIGLNPVAAFTADHMDLIMSKYPDTPTLRQAIRRTMSVLLSYAARTLKWIPSNPLIRTDKPRKQQEEGQKPFTEPEIAHYRERHPYGTRERLVYEIGLSTGFRREDIALVLGDDILAGLIPLLTNKAGVLVVAPVTRHLKEAYVAFRAAHPKVRGCRYAIGSQRSGKPIHKRTVSAFMEAAFKAAGFLQGQRIHALRYTAAVRLYERNFSIADIAEHTGHRMAAMAEKYCEKRRKATVRALTLDGFDDELDDLVDEAFAETDAGGTPKLRFLRAEGPARAGKPRNRPPSVRGNELSFDEDEPAWPGPPPGADLTNPEGPSCRPSGSSGVAVGGPYLIGTRAAPTATGRRRPRAGWRR